MPPDSSELSELEQETLLFWVDFASQLGFSKSIGEAYGLMFISENPLNADDLVERLSISRSGAGMALKTLSDIGAIRRATHLNSRKDHFELQTDLGILIRRLLNSRILPKIDEINHRREQLSEQAIRENAQHLLNRFEKLERWSKKASPLSLLLKTLFNN